MIVGFISLIFGFIETLVALRFTMRLIGADPTNGFVNWVYDWSAPLVAPFAGIFGQHSPLSGLSVAAQSVFEWTSLIALLVYALIGALILRIIGSHR